MTVVNIVGSSLDEIWGSYDLQKSKKKTNRKNREMCKPKNDERGKRDEYDDIMGYSSYDWHDKARYSRTHHPLEDTDAEEREDVDKYITIPSSVDSPDAKIVKEHYSSGHTDDRERIYLDLSMYVFSGIALIFILEQFVTIGMALKS